MSRPLNLLNLKENTKCYFDQLLSWYLDKPYDGPSYGTNLQKKLCDKVFNQELEILCEENDIKFISIFESLLNKDLTALIYLEQLQGSFKSKSNATHYQRNEIEIFIVFLFFTSYGRHNDLNNLLFQENELQLIILISKVSSRLTSLITFN